MDRSLDDERGGPASGRLSALQRLKERLSKFRAEREKVPILKRELISTPKAAVWVSSLSLAIAASGLSIMAENQKAQKNIDALLEFRQLYLAQNRLLNFYDCVHRRAPEIFVNEKALAAIRQDTENMRHTMLADNVKDFGYDVQRAAIGGGLMILSEAETQISHLLASATDDQIKSFKEQCRFGQGGW